MPSNESSRAASEISVKTIVIGDKAPGVVKSYLRAIVFDFDVASARWFMKPYKVVIVSSGTDKGMKVFECM